MANQSSADALLGSLKHLRSESTVATPQPAQQSYSEEEIIKTPNIPNPLETSKRMQQFFSQHSSDQDQLVSPASLRAPIEEKRVVMQRGEDFVVEVREKRVVKKNFLMPPTIANQLANEAKKLGISQNELINQILKQRYSTTHSDL